MTTSAFDMKRLSDPELALWRRISVFEGSFSQEALRAVGASGGISQAQAADLLRQLIARAAVVAEPGATDRYRIPDALRQDARAELLASGEQQQVYQRLVGFYTALAGQMLDEAFGQQRMAWMRRIKQEHDNLRAALEWLAAQGDAEQGLRLTFLLQELWFEEKYTGEGRAWFERLFALPYAAAPTTLRAQALDLAGALALNQGDYTAARELKQQGLSILRELGDPQPIGYALLHLAHLEGYAQGDFAAAQALYQSGLEIFQELVHAEGIAHAHANLGNIAIITGDFAAAGPLVAECLRMYRELGMSYEMAWSLGPAAGVAAGTDQPERALRLAGASAAHCATIGVSQPRIFLERNERMLERAREALPEEQQAALWSEGQAMSLERAVEYALEELG